MAAILVALVLAAAIPIGASAYIDAKWGGLRRGMTRAQVERHLLIFARHSNPTYNAINPGQFGIWYEFMGLGKSGTIGVIYNADGTVCDAIPIYSN